MSVKTYHVLGLMSGSSLDGLDIAFCRFEVQRTEKQELIVNNWKIEKAATLPFSEKWTNRLKHLPQQSALVFAKTHVYFGHYLAELVNEFITQFSVQPDFIASHGHTIFHFPEHRMTTQIGDGAALAALTGYPVISDFRNQDVALDGEGAPVAPIVDRYLLPEYDLYLNLGGIANISSVISGEEIIAFDICPTNQLLDNLAAQLGLSYDEGGAIAASGEIFTDLLEELNGLDYYQRPFPKSLDNSWSYQHILTHLENAEPKDIPHLLRTLVEHIAFQIGQSTHQISSNSPLPNARMLVTGGGAFNTFLMERTQYFCKNTEIIIPDAKVVQFKEALLMAWMGVLRIENEANVLASATGARRNTITGAIHQGWRKPL